jgi:uncharacterized membrane protein HdeD (DUF308 family)
MFTSRVFVRRATRGSSAGWWLALLNGIALIGLGLLIVLLPSLLVVFVSSLLIAAGALSLVAALRIRRRLGSRQYHVLAREWWMDA